MLHLLMPGPLAVTQSASVEQGFPVVPSLGPVHRLLPASPAPPSSVTTTTDIASMCVTVPPSDGDEVLLEQPWAMTAASALAAKKPMDLLYMACLLARIPAQPGGSSATTEATFPWILRQLGWRRPHESPHESLHETV